MVDYARNQTDLEAPESHTSISGMFVKKWNFAGQGEGIEGSTWTHHMITLHYPEENGLMERANRILRESLDGEYLENLLEAQKELKQHVERYNQKRLHSAIGNLPP